MNRIQKYLSFIFIAGFLSSCGGDSPVEQTRPNSNPPKEDATPQPQQAVMEEHEEVFATNIVNGQYALQSMDCLSENGSVEDPDLEVYKDYLWLKSLEQDLQSRNFDPILSQLDKELQTFQQNQTEAEQKIAQDSSQLQLLKAELDKNKQAARDYLSQLGKDFQSGVLTEDDYKQKEKELVGPLAERAKELLVEIQALSDKIEKSSPNLAREVSVAKSSSNFVEALTTKIESFKADKELPVPQELASISLKLGFPYTSFIYHYGINQCEIYRTFVSDNLVSDPNVKVSFNGEKLSSTVQFDSFEESRNLDESYSKDCGHYLPIPIRPKDQFYENVSTPSFDGAVEFEFSKDQQLFLTIKSSTPERVSDVCGPGFDSVVWKFKQI